MKILVESYFMSTGLFHRTMEKNLLEYTEWVVRATNRGFVFSDGSVGDVIHAVEPTGREKMYFKIYKENFE